MASATSLLALLLVDSQEAAATLLLPFGNVLIGQTATGTDVITITGGSGSTITIAAPTGPFGGAAISQKLATSPETVTGTYTFAPLSIGSATFLDPVKSNGSTLASLTLTGNGVAPVVAGPVTSASASNFILVGQTGSIALSVSNIGSGNLAGTGTAYNLNGSFGAGNSIFVGTASSFGLQDSNYTGTGKQTSATYAYTFKPTLTGATTTTVVTSFTNGVGSTNSVGSVTTTLAGTGVAPVQAVTANATTYARIGSTNNTSVTVANIGNGNLAGTGTAYNLNGSVSAVLGTGFGGATAGTISLASDATSGASSTTTTTLGYTYTPLSRGTATSTVAIAFSNGNSAGSNTAQTVSSVLTGTAVGPTYRSSIQGGAVNTPSVTGTGGSVAAAGSTISFGTVGKGFSQTVYLALQNTSTDANGGNSLLTALTIDQYTITGADASAFSISSIAGSVITEGGTLLVPITVTGTSLIGTLNSTLTIFTDESVALGGAGDTFTYALTSYSVPEPTSLAVLGAGLAGLVSFRRRRQAAA